MDHWFFGPGFCCQRRSYRRPRIVSPVETESERATAWRSCNVRLIETVRATLHLGHALNCQALLHQRKVKKQLLASLLAPAPERRGAARSTGLASAHNIRLNSLEFLRHCFVGPGQRNNSLRDETIFRFGRRTAETPHGYQDTNDNGGKPAITGDSQMRTLSIILAFAFVLVSPSMAGSVDSGLPGVGTFAYTGPPVLASVPQAIAVPAG